MAAPLSIEADVSAVQEALAGTSKSLKAIERQTLRIAAKATAKRIRALIGSSGLKSRTGELKKAYAYKVKKSGTEAVVFPKALNGGKTIFPKAMTLSYGHEGKTARASNWKIAPCGFVQGGQAYAESGEYMGEVQKMVDKELQKYWG